MKYPNFTGNEPCASIGVNFYYVEGQGSFSSTEYAVMKSACLERCHMLEECTQWALHHEAHGYWAGMGEKERQRMRARLGISLSDPTVTVSPVWKERHAS